MNGVLFLLLGLQLLVLPLSLSLLTAGLIAIPVCSSHFCQRDDGDLQVGTLPRQRVTDNLLISSWGGLRWALALSLPSEPAAERNLLLAATYVVVGFSILLQGLTIPHYSAG